HGGKDNITVVLFRLESDGDEDESGDTLGGDEMDAATVREAAAADEGATTALSADEAEEERALARAEPRRSPVRVLPPSRAGAEERDRPRRRGGTRIRRRIGALLALLAVVAAVVGLYAGSRQFYFLGTDDRGVIALYRGLPYELPFGIRLYTREYSTDVPASRIVDRRERKNLLDHQLR